MKFGITQESNYKNLASEDFYLINHLSSIDKLGRLKNDSKEDFVL